MISDSVLCVCWWPPAVPQEGHEQDWILPKRREASWLSAVLSSSHASFETTEPQPWPDDTSYRAHKRANVIRAKRDKRQTACFLNKNNTGWLLISASQQVWVLSCLLQQLFWNWGCIYIPTKHCHGPILPSRPLSKWQTDVFLLFPLFYCLNVKTWYDEKI